MTHASAPTLHSANPVLQPSSHIDAAYEVSQLSFFFLVQSYKFETHRNFLRVINLKLLINPHRKTVSQSRCGVRRLNPLIYFSSSEIQLYFMILATCFRSLIILCFNNQQKHLPQTLESDLLSISPGSFIYDSLLCTVLEI